MGGGVAEQALGLAGIRLAVADVAGAELPVAGLGIGRHAVGGEVVAQQLEQPVERGAIAHGHVVNLVQRVRIGGGGGQQIGLHGVGHVAEIAAGFAITVDPHGFALQQRGRPLGNHGGIGAVGILPRPEHVEVAQANGLEAVAVGEYVGIQLVDVLGDGIGAERLANALLHLGQGRMVAIGAAAAGIHKALHLGIARGHQHVEEAGDVGGVGVGRVCQAARHAAQRGLVQHVIDAFAGTGAVFRLADVTFNEAEAAPLLRSHKTLHFLQVVAKAGGEVVQAHHALIQLQQRFQQVGADEAGNAGHQPGARIGRQLLQQAFVGGHCADHAD